MDGVRTSDVILTLGSFVVFCLWFYLGKAVINSVAYAAAVGEAGEHADRAEQLAHKRLRSMSWLVGLLTSLVMTVFSVYTTTQFVSRAVVSWAATAQWLESDDPLGRAVTCFFIASLFADIGLGLLHYPAQVSCEAAALAADPPL